MSILSRADTKSRRLVYTGVFSALAMIFSYIEVLLPLGISFLPGFKLGLANVVTVIAVYMLGDIYGGTVSLLRIFLTALLFGNAQSLMFSLFGGILAFAVTVFCKHILKSRVTFIGVSVLSAAAHNTGQIIAASILFGDAAIFGYLPILIVASVIYGAVVGVLLNITAARLTRSEKEKDT